MKRIILILVVIVVALGIGFVAHALWPHNEGIQTNPQGAPQTMNSLSASTTGYSGIVAHPDERIIGSLSAKGKASTTDDGVLKSLQ